MVLIFITQQLHQLFTAVEIIYYSTGRKQAAICCETFLQHSQKLEVENANMMEWESQSRNLSWEEFQNPYWMFEKFARSRKWEEFLQELMEQAMSNGSIEGYYKIGEVMKWRERMLGVVEGCYMVKLRVKGQNET